MATKFIDFIQQQDAVAFKESFEAAVSEKVFNVLEAKKQEIAQSFFTEKKHVCPECGKAKCMCESESSERMGDPLAHSELAHHVANASATAAAAEHHKINFHAHINKHTEAMAHGDHHAAHHHMEKAKMHAKAHHELTGHPIHEEVAESYSVAEARAFSYGAADKLANKIDDAESSAHAKSIISKAPTIHLQYLHHFNMGLSGGGEIHKYIPHIKAELAKRNSLLSREKSSKRFDESIEEDAKGYKQVGGFTGMGTPKAGKKSWHYPAPAKHVGDIHSKEHPAPGDSKGMQIHSKMNPHHDDHGKHHGKHHGVEGVGSKEHPHHKALNEFGSPKHVEAQHLKPNEVVRSVFPNTFGDTTDDTIERHRDVAKHHNSGYSSSPSQRERMKYIVGRKTEVPPSYIYHKEEYEKKHGKLHHKMTKKMMKLAHKHSKKHHEEEE